MYLSFEGPQAVVPLEERGKAFDELTTSAGHRLVAALDDIAAGHYPPRPETKNLCTMCAFVAVCRHPGGAGREPAEDTETSAEGSDGCLSSRGSSSTRRRSAGDARRAGAAAGGRSAAQRRARSVGGHRQDARARRSLRAPARSRRGAAQHPGDHLYAQGRGGNAPARDGDAAAASPRRRHHRRRAGARSATRSATSASAPSTPSACRCCTNFRSRPASIPGSTSPTKPKRRASSKRRSTARWRSAAAISLDDPDVALLFTELGEPRLRKALTALLDRRLVARDALNRFLRGRDMSVDAACHRLLHSLRGAMSSIAGGDGRAVARRLSPPVRTSPGFDLLAREMRRADGRSADAAGAAARRCSIASRTWC